MSIFVSNRRPPEFKSRTFPLYQPARSDVVDFDVKRFDVMCIKHSHESRKIIHFLTPIILE
jgi:hypothetical protein